MSLGSILRSHSMMVILSKVGDHFSSAVRALPSTKVLLGRRCWMAWWRSL